MDSAGRVRLILYTHFKYLKSDTFSQRIKCPGKEEFMDIDPLIHFKVSETTVLRARPTAGAPAVEPVKQNLIDEYVEEKDGGQKY